MGRLARLGTSNTTHKFYSYRSRSDAHCFQYEGLGEETPFTADKETEEKAGENL
jgi:hypothetical protein